MGCAFQAYEIELQDEEGNNAVLSLQRPRLTRLFLVANAYRLPLRIEPGGGPVREFLPAVWTSLIPGILWAVRSSCASSSSSSAGWTRTATALWQSPR